MNVVSARRRKDNKKDYAPRVRGSQPLPSVGTSAAKLRLEACAKTLRAYGPSIVEALVVQARSDGYPSPESHGRCTLAAMIKALDRLSL